MISCVLRILASHNKFQLLYDEIYNIYKIHRVAIPFSLILSNQIYHYKIKIKFYLSTENTRAILPMARILFLITSFLCWDCPRIKEQIKRHSLKSSFLVDVRIFCKRINSCKIKIITEPCTGQINNKYRKKR